jgi:transposase InsO family protein
LLQLDDCLNALHRCLQRHGISRLPDIESDKALLRDVEGPKR